MIKLCVASERGESFFGVALGAGTCQLAFVRIFVAGNTIGKHKISKLLKLLAIAGGHGVALNTIHFDVSAQQGKLRIVMVKARGWAEVFKIVAGGTIIAKCILVVVFVAGDTVFFEPHEGAFTRGNLCILDVIGLVAVATIDTEVTAFEDVAGEVVIEVVFIETHHVELPAMVFAVALYAFFVEDLFAGVVAAVGIDKVLDVFVTGQALGGGGQPFTEYVTFGAVAYTFQLFVCVRKVAGGDLREGGEGEEGQ